ncbi:MAG: serine/threonine protein kinase, partial [Pirellulaceae bacterium]|nr:serine/threonine protein kinase [Pirellulaceae bacterium]
MRSVLASKLVTIDDIKKVVASLLIDSDLFTPQRISDGLVAAGMLTPWQSAKILAGRNRGFFLGSYRLLRPLGKGGMGVVYLAEHHVMKRLMALKILPPESSSNARRIECFKQEARAAAQLDHQNIVRAYDFSECEGKLYIVMEYVDGIDLRQAVARDGVFSVPAAMDILQQSIAGLAHAHQRGIIHRDIKPSNLLLRSDGVVKISDMGLARVGRSDVGGLESKNRLIGSADFVAPEQVIDSTLADARS